MQMPLSKVAYHDAFISDRGEHGAQIPKVQTGSERPLSQGRLKEAWALGIGPSTFWLGSLKPLSYIQLYREYAIWVRVDCYITGMKKHDVLC